MATDSSKMNIKGSLRVKFLLVMSILLFTSLSTYLLLAVSLFNKDKTTYIYEGNATLVSTMAAEASANLRSVEKTLNLIHSELRNSQAVNQSNIEQLFRTEDEIVDIAVFKADHYPKQAMLRFTREDFYAPYHLPDKEIWSYELSLLPQISNKKTPRWLVYNAAIKSQIPLLGIISTRGNQAGPSPWILLVHLRQDRRSKIFSRSETFLTYLSDKYGQILVHQDPSKTLDRNSKVAPDLLSQINSSKFETGVKAARINGRDIIYAYSKIDAFGLIVVSEIETAKAFIGTRRLIEKSILFAILIMVVSLIVSVLFSKRITASLVRLYEATQQIMNGNFLVSVNVQSSDEVGALSWSFNRMAGEISRLMEETADKARIEKELETAQLVQDNFFPINELTVGPLRLAAFYQPASECGGDWWGHIVLDEKVVILIGDATGHGVPSALITAAAQSCCSTLEEFKRDFPAVELTPSMILGKLNNSIFRASRGTVKMTFFCTMIDTKTGKMTYANASHEMPFWCVANKKDPKAVRQKKDVQVCTGAPGMILGNELKYTVGEHEMQLAPGDTIVLYTDGLVECKNASEEMYGKGRMLRQTFKNAHQTAAELRDVMVKDTTSFFGQRAHDDDITLVVLKIDESAEFKVSKKKAA